MSVPALDKLSHRYYTVREVEAITHYSCPTIRSEIKNGRLKASRLSTHGHFRVNGRDLYHWLVSNASNSILNLIQGDNQ